MDLAEGHIVLTEVPYHILCVSTDCPVRLPLLLLATAFSKRVVVVFNYLANIPAMILSA
jgi:hypothetical protein